MPIIYNAPGRPPCPLPRSRRKLPAAGRRVELDTYWRRRLRDGDVVLEDPRPNRKRRTRPRAEPEG